MPLEPLEADETLGQVEPDGQALEPSRGRGPAPKKARAAEGRAAKRIKGRTVYLPDDLFERVIVQAHRKGRTISEYVAALLERHVPDHRVVRADASPAADEAAA